MIQFLHEHRIPLLTITILTLLVWAGILNQAILGEGYYYFDPSQHFIVNGGINNISQYDNLARIIFDVIAPIFQDKIILYLWLEMIVIIFINLVLYQTVYKATRNKALSLISVIMFNSNYMASYEMNAIGNYQRFVQRQPNIIFMLYSLQFFIEYMRTHKRKTGVISYVLYVLGIVMAHFSVFLMPIFFIFPLTFLAFNSNKFKKVELIAISAFVFLTTALIVLPDGHHPISIFEFISHYHDITLKLLIQIANTVFPPSIVETIVAITGGKFEYIRDYSRFGLFAILLFVLGFFLIRADKMLRSFQNLYLALLFSVPPTLFMTQWLYLDVINPLTQLTQARFYYAPSIATSVLWGALLYAIYKRMGSSKVFLVSVLGVYIMYNSFLINRDISQSQFKSIAMKKYLTSVLAHRQELGSGSTIVTSTSLSWPAPMINYLVGQNKIVHLQFEPNWERGLIEGNKERIFLYGYDYTKDLVIDFTSKYREGKTIDYTKLR